MPSKQLARVRVPEDALATYIYFIFLSFCAPKSHPDIHNVIGQTTCFLPNLNQLTSTVHSVLGFKTRTWQTVRMFFPALNATGTPRTPRTVRRDKLQTSCIVSPSRTLIPSRDCTCTGLTSIKRIVVSIDLTHYCSCPMFQAQRECPTSGLQPVTQKPWFQGSCPLAQIQLACPTSQTRPVQE